MQVLSQHCRKPHNYLLLPICELSAHIRSMTDHTELSQSASQQQMLLLHYIFKEEVHLSKWRQESTTCAERPNTGYLFSLDAFHWCSGKHSCWVVHTASRPNQASPMPCHAISTIQHRDLVYLVSAPRGKNKLTQYFLTGQCK